MRAFAIVCAVLVLTATQALAVVVDIPMDQQINLGYTYNSQSPNGDAIYAAFTAGTATFHTDGVDGWARHNINQSGWWYMYVDLNLAGIGALDMSAPGSLIEFDCRYFQDPETNTNPYADAPVFARIYTYAPDGNTYLGHRDYSIVYATQSPWNNPPYPTWTHVTIDVHGSAYADGGAFDPTKVSRIRWYGTDWSWTYPADFVDFKDLKITAVPEPGAMLALLAGFAGLVPAIRRRK